MFIDKVKIFVKAGNGGRGAISFHTEKYIPNGGPDGGDGGDGGDLVLVATKSQNTLNEFHFKKHFRAEDGTAGSAKNCSGKCGENLEVLVPCGTIVKDPLSGKVLVDMFEDGQRHVLLKGGKGGKGNARFATSKRQAPRFSEQGEKTEEYAVELELKTIADVGLIGFPNVGKSTLLSVVSQAKPKIANYHFTTLSPNLGVINCHGQTFVMADIPGLIEGASLGAGLGHAFLRHVERTRLFVHVLDISGSEDRDPIEDFEKINNEISSYNPKLKRIPQIVAANKMDMPNAEENLKKFKAKYGNRYKIVPVTTIIAEGCDTLIEMCAELLAKLPAQEPLQIEPSLLGEKEAKPRFAVEKLDDGVFEVTGSLIDTMIRKIVVSDNQSFRYFEKVLRDEGVISTLKKQGLKDGDTVIIGDVEFEYTD